MLQDWWLNEVLRKILHSKIEHVKVKKLLFTYMVI